MTTSETTICNMALGHIGDSNGIASLDEASAAARACTLYYEQARDEVIQELAPQFARRSAALGLVTDYTSARLSTSTAMRTASRRRARRGAHPERLDAARHGHEPAAVARDER
jgi:F0F1-type ATP synthase gamma subunit